jgi:hypothetical protein
MPNTAQATRPDIDAQEMERPRRSRAISNQSNASRNDGTDPSDSPPTVAMSIPLDVGYRPDETVDEPGPRPSPPTELTAEQAARARQFIESCLRRKRRRELAAERSAA